MHLLTYALSIGIRYCHLLNIHIFKKFPIYIKRKNGYCLFLRDIFCVLLHINAQNSIHNWKILQQCFYVRSLLDCFWKQWKLGSILMIGKSTTLLVKSTQYKKLAPNALRVTYYLKSCKLHEKNETKNIRVLLFSLSSINLPLHSDAFCFVFSYGL